jgi:DNA-binding response OmpR family regulator
MKTLEKGNSSWRGVCGTLGMEGPRNGTIVLVAEDDPHALSGYVEFLSTAGFVAYGRGDGRGALSAALETIPDIVVTDIAMPGLDGFELMAALRADRRTKHVPIVGMTAHWTAETQSEAQRAGFSAMLLKPCLPTHLLAEIKRVLKHAKLMTAGLGSDTTEAEAELPVGLRNAVLRRRGVDY